MAENLGCAQPTGTVVGEQKITENASEEQAITEDMKMAVQVGKKAPDFEAPAYHKGTFTNMKLSDSLGKWVLLCFYPGDFTFV